MLQHLNTQPPWIHCSHGDAQAPQAEPWGKNAQPLEQAMQAGNACQGVAWNAGPCAETSGTTRARYERGISSSTKQTSASFCSISI